LALHLSPEAATVAGDRKRLVQVVTNLLNNAAKYTPEGGDIVLSTQVQGTEVVLGVKDNGIGMEPALAQRAFELFAQAERSPDRASGGLGLGLALVKSLVELHGGTVSCESEGPGKGSLFTVRLPLVAVKKGDLHKPRKTAMPPTVSRPLRVLVVDDNADAAHMLAMFLEVSGYIAMVENNPRKALENIESLAPDVCLLDIGLPEMDGNELARKLRSLPAAADVLLVAITGYGYESDRKASLAAGFDHHLVKPVDPHELLVLLAAAQK
jgi:CheY-like chemotaxis protein